jgi:hypothetical protein
MSNDAPSSAPKPVPSNILEMNDPHISVTEALTWITGQRWAQKRRS